MDELIYTHRFVVGDWSDDGHGKSETFTFKSNYNELHIQQLYLQASEKSGVAMHEEIVDILDDRISLFQEYEEDYLTEEHLARFKKIGMDTLIADLDNYGSADFEEGRYYCTPSSVLWVFLAMVQSQDADFDFQPIAEHKPLNGFWHDTFNHSFGYGVFH